ncbi:hypothetical protein EVAR_44689_1 [Eumeta japonica]|uniref:Uncharacterized protein n=1 Tax=Eumeta variegata TaxID=151549 RepID=A0A4C1XK06_EUMVA|nr:hypothetical protein EVAR_44689_1 [Eumeta japonica]
MSSILFHGSGLSRQAALFRRQCDVRSPAFKEQPANRKRVNERLTLALCPVKCRPAPRAVLTGGRGAAPARPGARLEPTNDTNTNVRSNRITFGPLALRASPVQVALFPTTKSDGSACSLSAADGLANADRRTRESVKDERARPRIAKQYNPSQPQPNWLSKLASCTQNTCIRRRKRTPIRSFERYLYKPSFVFRTINIRAANQCGRLKDHGPKSPRPLGLKRKGLGQVCLSRVVHSVVITEVEDAKGPILQSPAREES